jgi:hypothetical protein
MLRGQVLELIHLCRLFFLIFGDLLTLRRVEDELGQLVDEENVLVSLKARVKKKKMRKELTVPVCSDKVVVLNAL